MFWVLFRHFGPETQLQDDTPGGWARGLRHNATQCVPALGPRAVEGGRSPQERPSPGSPQVHFTTSITISFLGTRRDGNLSHKT